MGKISNTVLTSKDQGLTSGQQKNARENIDAMGKLSKWRYGDVIVSGDGGEVIDSGIRLSPDGKIFAQSDWNETDPDDPAYIINKPDLTAYADKAYVDAEINSTKEYVTDNFPTKTYVDDNFATKTYVDNNYATKTYVDNTFPTKTYVNSTYATKTFVNDNFPTKTYVETTYASKEYANDTFPTKTYVTGELDKKADKVTGATAGNLASLTASGNLADSGIAASDLVVDSDLAAIAFSGSYNDLVDKPVTKSLVAGNNITITPGSTTITIASTIPADQLQSDWNQSDSTKSDYIKNKPTLHDHANKATLDQIPAPSADNNMLFYDGNPRAMEWVTWSSESFAVEGN